MTAVRFADSLKYGVVIFGYFVGVTVPGLGGMALGALVAVPELSAWLDGDSVSQAALAGGAVLVALGAAVWFAGLFAIARKLLADAVSAGVADGQGDITVRLPSADTGTVTQPTRTIRRESGTDGDSDRQEAGDVRTVEGTPSAAPRDTAPASAAETAGPADPSEEVPRTEAEAGERGWSGNEGGLDDQQAVEGAAENAREAERGETDETEPKQTAEEIAFGEAGERDGESATDADGDEAATQQSNTGGSAGDADESESRTDIWETVEPGTGQRDENPADSTAHPDAGGDSLDGTTEAANEGSSDPRTDRPTDE